MGNQTPKRWRAIVGLAVAWAAISVPAHAIDDWRYQVDFKWADAVDGADRIEQRIAALMPFTACGNEQDFLGHLSLQKANEHHQPGEGVAATVVAKAEWLRRSVLREGGPETITPEVCKAKYRFDVDPEWSGEERTHGVALLVAEGQPNPYDERFGGDCSGATTKVTFDPQNATIATAESTVPNLCLRRQINVAIWEWRNNRQLGTENLPCMFWLGGATEADFDVTVRDLTRLYFIDRATGGAVLDDQVRERLRDQLLSVSGAPMRAESYSLFECGNTEKSQGTPEEIAAAQGANPFLEDVFNDLWPGIKWLLLRILLVFVVALGAGAIAAALATAGAPALAAALASGAAASVVAAAVGFGRIPETENHMLMIESSRYLKNQILIEYYRENGMDGDVAAFEGHQAELRAWLLDRMHRVMVAEFDEYNSRPYQRYSLIALLNLFDYAQDPTMSLREGAQIVLDRQLAKYVVGSSQGRRFAPFRRQMDRIAGKFDRPDDTVVPGGRDHATHVADLTDSDFPASMAQLYFGHTEQLVDGRIHLGSVGSLTQLATSRYRPPAMLIDLALRPGGGLEPGTADGIWQHTFRHDGHERYVRGRHFLLTAGGVEAGFANQFELLGAPIPYAGLNADRGAAFPTTLIIDGPQIGADGTRKPRDQLRSMLRIQGKRTDRGDFHTFDENLCVWKGFACGRDIRMPAAMWSCTMQGPRRNGASWRFFDSAACPGFDPVRRVFIVLVSSESNPAEPEPGAGFILGDGFFEAIDAVDVGGDFAAFRQNLLAANPGIGYRRGDYRSARGEAIGWDISPGRVVRIDGNPVPGPDNWQWGVDGNVMVQTAPGIVEIRNERLGSRLVLDFFIPSAPRRTEP